MEAQWHRLQP